MSRKLLFTILASLFIITRGYIITFPPYDEIRRPHDSYSDVKHDYERYANMWYYGLTPYLKHYYEYPPATIPLLSTPLILDQHGIGKYYPNYRKQILIIDFLVFIAILAALSKIPSSRKSRIFGVSYYLFAPVVAKDFFYEGIDLAFIGSMTAGIVSLLYFSQAEILKRTIFWAFFWLSTAIKFMSIPLLAPFFWLKQLSLKKEIVACALGFLIIWGLPLIIFRSSLAVSVVFHFNRHIKYASFPAYIIQTANRFTNSEVRLNEPPDFPFLGPVSTGVEKADALIFPLSLLIVLGYGLYCLTKHSATDSWTVQIRKLLFLEKLDLSHLNTYAFSVKITLIFVFMLFITGKIFSQPFHIWYIPLLAIFPFQKLRQQVFFYIVTLWVLILDTTSWIRLPETLIAIGPLPTSYFLYTSRFIAFFALLFMAFKLPHHKKPLA